MHVETKFYECSESKLIYIAIRTQRRVSLLTQYDKSFYFSIKNNICIISLNIPAKCYKPRS